MDLPIRILNQPVPKYIKKGDARGCGASKRVPGGCWSGWYKVWSPQQTGRVVIRRSVASPTIPSWNQMREFLMEMRRLRETGIPAA